MSALMIEIPEQSLTALQVPADEAAQEVRMLLAVKLFELDRISSGAAARLAGIPRTLFLQRLGDYGVDTFRLTGEELDRETPLV